MDTDRIVDGNRDMRWVSHAVVCGLAVLLIPLGGLCGCEEASNERPSRRSPRPPRKALVQQVDCENVILISIDTLRADHLGCYGHPFARSPRIDALAAEGWRFTQHINAAPTTLASHTSLMTGTYPHTHGVAKNGYTVNEDNVMLAEVLGRAGFTCAAFIGAFPLDAEFGFDQGFDAYDCRYSMAGGKGEERDQAQRRADEVTAATIAWLDQHRSEVPAGAPGRDRLFLFVHYFDVHWPYEAPPPYGRMYRQDTLRIEPTMDAIRKVRGMLRKNDPAAMDYARALDAEYCAELTYCDEQIGHLLDRLKNRGLYDNSLIIVTSDHGETMHEHFNVFNHGMSVYDTEVLTPLIIRFPGGRFGGRVIDHLVSNIDIAPTILHLLGLPEHDELEGLSFAGIIDGPIPPRGPVFCEATQPWSHPMFHSDKRWLNRDKFQAIRSATHKYMFRLPDERFEFYDLRNDPLEQVNLLSSQRAHDVALAQRMRRQLEQWRDLANPLPSTELASQRVHDKLRSLGYVGDGDDEEYDAPSEYLEVETQPANRLPTSEPG